MPLAIIALGGIRISLPAEELRAARDYVDFCQNNALTDYDPLPERRFGKWKTGTLFALSAAPGFGCLFAALFHSRRTAYGLVVYFICLCGFDIADFTSYLFIFTLMLLHAKYIALPKIRKARHDPARPL